MMDSGGGKSPSSPFLVWGLFSPLLFFSPLLPPVLFVFQMKLPASAFIGLAKPWWQFWEGRTGTAILWDCSEAQEVIKLLKMSQLIHSCCQNLLSSVKAILSEKEQWLSKAGSCQFSFSSVDAFFPRSWLSSMISIRSLVSLYRCWTLLFLVINNASPVPFLSCGFYWPKVIFWDVVNCLHFSSCIVTEAFWELFSKCVSQLHANGILTSRDVRRYVSPQKKISQDRNTILGTK